MGRDRVILLDGLEETIALGAQVASLLEPNMVIALSGDLGAGKTTLLQGLAAALGIYEPIVSPTFVYLQIYEAGRLPFFHFDLYRMKNSSDFLGLGFEEYFEKGGVTAIEWPERITPLLPPATLFIYLLQEGEKRRAKLSFAL